MHKALGKILHTPALCAVWLEDNCHGENLQTSTDRQIDKSARLTESNDSIAATAENFIKFEATYKKHESHIQHIVSERASDIELFSSELRRLIRDMTLKSRWIIKRVVENNCVIYSTNSTSHQFNISSLLSSMHRKLTNKK